MTEQTETPEADSPAGRDKNELLCASDRIELERVLTACKTKLQIYRAHSDGEYRGGIEHQALIELIERTYTRFCT